MNMKKEVSTISKEEAEELLGGKAHNVSSHSDADGISAAVLFSLAWKVNSIRFPERFGDVKNGETVLDMTPLEEGFEGIIIDHHIPRCEYPNAVYLHGDEPATYLVYSLSKERIPPEQRWKVVIGCVGDGSEEVVPPDVWIKNKDLIVEMSQVYSGRGGIDLYPRPLFEKLSPALNAFARTGHPDIGYRVLMQSATPRDFLSHTLVDEHKKMLQQEESRVLKEYPVREVGPVYYWEINTSFHMSYLASKLLSKKHKTVILVNAYNNSLSIRGPLAEVARVFLSDICDLGGHRGFIGGSIKAGVDRKEVLRTFIRKWWST